MINTILLVSGVAIVLFVVSFIANKIGDAAQSRVDSVSEARAKAAAIDAEHASYLKKKTEAEHRAGDKWKLPPKGGSSDPQLPPLRWESEG